jgi:hypothetical protein
LALLFLLLPLRYSFTLLILSPAAFFDTRIALARPVAWSKATRTTNGISTGYNTVTWEQTATTCPFKPHW